MIKKKTTTKRPTTKKPTTKRPTKPNQTKRKRKKKPSLKIRYLKMIVVIIAAILGIKLSTSDLSLNNIDKIYYKITRSLEKSRVEKPNIENSEDGKYKVTKVVDGDTIEIFYNKKKEKVRLIGVDTPESVHRDKSRNKKEGKIASDFTKQYLENKNIVIEFDVSPRDKYGRLLAYVYMEDGKMFNEILLEKGYAKVVTYPPNVKYHKHFLEIQKKAIKNNIGFWKLKDVFK